MSCTDTLIVNSPVEATAQIARWTICSDDIYLLRFHEKPPGWLEDIFNQIIDDTNLADDVSDLEDRFANFQEGYTAHFYDWVEGDTNTLAYVETIYTTNTEFNAGLQEIKVAYVSHDESGAMFDQLVGAWQTGAGGAWFNERVSVVSNVAYSAAKSASTLTATMFSQQDNINAIIGDIEVLEKQVDGKVVTWFVSSTDQGDNTPFDTIGPVNPDNTVNEDGKPYWCWLPGNICSDDIYNDDTDLDTRAEHTGDTYVYYEVDSNGNKHIISTWRFGKDPYDDTDSYSWFIFTDDIATQAYQQSIDAQVTADSKIVSFYQPTPPNTITDPGLHDGDIWVDSDDDNKLYRYSGTQWIEVRDKQITASVDRLDEATVDVSGIATAKSSLVVNADGNISGYRASATNDPSDPGSEFRIFADKFYLAATGGTSARYAPFFVDTNTRDIWFNGLVNFRNILTDQGEDPGWLFAGQAAKDINTYETTIDGGKITTYSLNANRIAVNTVWVQGRVVSEEFKYNTTGYVGGGTCSTGPNGFMLNAQAGMGSWNYPNIYGSYIRGGTIAAGKFECGYFGYDNWLLSACPDGTHYGRSGYVTTAEYSMNYRDPTFIKYLAIGTVFDSCYGAGFAKNRALGKNSSVMITGNFNFFTDLGPQVTIQILHNGVVKAQLVRNNFGNIDMEVSFSIAYAFDGFSNTANGRHDFTLVAAANNVFAVDMNATLTLIN